MDSRKKGRESLTKVHASFVKTPVGKQDLEGPEERGWELEDGCLRPVYMTKELAPRSLVELTTCKYEKSCSRGNCNESCCNPHTAAVQLLSDSENDSDARGGVVLPYMSYIGMCGPKGYGFSAVLVINRVSILAILVLNRVWFLYTSLELGMLFRRSYFFIIIDKTISKSPSKLMLRATVSAATVINRVSKF